MARGVEVVSIWILYNCDMLFDLELVRWELPLIVGKNVRRRLEKAGSFFILHATVSKNCVEAGMSILRL